MLSNLKKRFTLTSKALEYIKKYQKIYKRVLKEAKKKKIKKAMIGMSQRHLTKLKLCGS